ncbi:spore germination protein [Cytobacillus firmus]|uniref:spore germination protein n=1 Tax=Cytobacillus firmus TaxID=1399 RepID=UPI000A9667AF|nr:spore germination protein [Cytobacillus firmus]MDD9313598.1 spore germination protein [Cytobacillus firmus]MEC1892881.1 spore germination protein [Cytobacillus firmus]MED1940072.1 spore germination protein [Cytobacillus firmus]MED4450476.1 spore germination protein [Cytobacillus firmus]MED4769740.1 spore germination protein [Cytobacillus firmus]
MLIYLTTMIDTKLLKETILQSISGKEDGFNLTTEDDLKSLCKEKFGGAGYQLVGSFDEIITSLLYGNIIILFKDMEKALSLSMAIGEDRSITEPSTQTVIRGPKDGFVESITTNVSLLRRRIKNRNLRFEKFIIGSETNTSVYIGYMEGTANEKIVGEVRKRLGQIKVNAIFESGNIEELIADKSATPFPLALNSERPDAVASNLLEGKIAILVDGTPFVLVVPAVLVDFFSIAEDYYQNFMMGSFLRIIRYLSFMIALITPSLYVGILTFHHELLPTPLLLGIIAQREGVPFPAVIEVILMEVTFEILREAGVRMPRAVGQTVSIVGALVIGQAAAEAGIISNIMVIIVAITAIANFVSPTYSFGAAARLLRFLLIIVSAILGLYGVLIVLVFIVAHLSSLRSFGIPYLSPVAPFIIEQQKDVFFRFPIWSMRKRPAYLKTQNPEKFPKTGSPSPPPMKGEQSN